MDPKLTKILLIGTLILLVILVPIFFNFLYSGSRKIKVFVNILILIAAAAWLLNILGKLDTVIETISQWVGSLLN